jgi:hypothetical protein
MTLGRAGQGNYWIRRLNSPDCDLLNKIAKCDDALSFPYALQATPP